MGDSYSTERFRLRSQHSKQLTALTNDHMHTRRQLEAKHKAELDALKVAHQAKGVLASKIGRPIVPRPDPDIVRGLWAGGCTAEDMAIQLNTTKARVYEALSTLREFHEVWALLKQGTWQSEIATRMGLPISAVQAVKLSVRKRGVAIDLSQAKRGPKGTNINLA